MNLNMGRLRSQLVLEEGLRLLPYDDHNGRPVVDDGVCIGKLTTGVGRNLDDNPLSPSEVKVIGHDGRTKAITHDQALILLDNDIKTVCKVLDLELPWWKYLDEVRARVMVDLCFNMGITTLKQFKHFLADLRMGNYALAADDLKDSRWYGQTKSRGVRLVEMIRTGKDWIK